MKKIVRLTESELKNIVETSVRRAIKEGAVDESWKGTLAGGALGAAALTAGVGAGAFDDQMDDIDRNSRAFPEDRVEYGDRLKPQSELPSDTISWEKANQFEGKISKAIAESVNKLLSELDWRTYYSARDKAAQQMDDPSIPKDVRNKRYAQHKKFFQAGEDQMEKQHNLNGTEVHNSMRGDYGKTFPSYTDAHIARRDRMDNLRGEYNNYANGKAQYKSGQGWQ